MDELLPEMRKKGCRMKPTDEERRAVAKRLRDVEPVELDGGEFVDCGEVETELGLRSDDGAWYEADAVRRLADLIEPEPERTCRYVPDASEQDADSDAFGCTNCGHMMIYDHEIGWFDDYPTYKPCFNYCPNCGSKVVSE